MPNPVLEELKDMARICSAPAFFNTIEDVRSVSLATFTRYAVHGSEVMDKLNALYGKHQARSLDSANRRVYIWKVPVQDGNTNFDLYVVSGKERGTSYEVHADLSKDEKVLEAAANKVLSWF